MALASPDKIPEYRKLLKSAFTKNRQAEMLLLGMIMGFLPCGLSFAAFTRALASGNPIKEFGVKSTIDFYHQDWYV